MKRRRILIGVGVALAVLALVGAGWLLASQFGTRSCAHFGPGMRGSPGQSWGMHPAVGGPVLFLFLGALVGGIALLVWGLARRDTPAATGDGSPLEILKRRYASGEIDRDEFQRVKESLLE